MKFINPQTVVAQIGLKGGAKVADLGSGSGFYAIAAAKIVGSDGLAYAVDVQEEKLAATQSAANQQGIKNIQLVLADLDRPLADIENTSCDAVILASILHEIHDLKQLLKTSYGLLKSGGRLLAVEWKKEHTPFGPAVEKRLDETTLSKELEALGMRKIKHIDADSYHYAVVFEK